MGHITSYLLGGLAAVASWSMVAPAEPGSGPSSLAAAFQYPATLGGSEGGFNRAAKGDRLAPARPGQPQTVATIEVVGVSDAAIIYRDRAGNLLYRTDPLNNVTVVAKGIKLPEVTVRQDALSTVRPVPIDVGNSGGKTGDKTGAKTKMLVGCEPAASPIASPHLSHLTGHCISQLTPSVLTPSFTVAAAFN
jgi:hypothetical protein